jgi:hypothetical protein
MKHTVVYDASRPECHKLVQDYLDEKGQFERWDYFMRCFRCSGLDLARATLSDVRFIAAVGV